MEKRKLTLEDVGSFLAKLAEKSESVYWLSSPDFTKIQYVSPAYEKIWGRSRDLLYNEPELWSTYLHPDDVKTQNPIHAMAERVAKEGTKARYQEHYRVIRPNGEVRWIIDNGFPIYDEEGNCCGVTGVAVDVTKDKLAEEALREAKEEAEAASKAKTEFLENMRHDIRTPLMGITGFADIIKNEVTDPRIKEYADNLIASSYSLLDLLNEILEVIKVSSGEVPLLIKKFDLDKKLTEVILLNQAKAHQKNIKLAYHFDENIPRYLIGDPTRIHRIILELVANALNFTDKGHVNVNVILAEDREEYSIIKIEVEDTGIGIKPEQQQDIYVKFKRLTPSYEGIYKGFGLGLSIAKQFIEDLQGELYVESELNRGSKFTVVLKLKKPLLNEPLGSEDLITTTPAKRIATTTVIENTSPDKTLISNEESKSRILVVEDSDIAARVVTNLLSKLDCVVDIAANGKLAVQLAKENAYDLIFMDIGLPDINGYETTKRIRLEERNDRHIPIIALTAHVDEENKQYCIGIGMNAVLTKPLAKEKAEDILNSFIPYRKEKLSLEKASDKKEIKKTKEPVLDLDFVIKQFGTKELAMEMITILHSSFEETNALLDKAYQARDWQQIQKLTHKLKGDASYCGMKRLQEACFNIENSIKEGKEELYEAFYKQVLNEIKVIEKELNKK